MQHLVLLAWWDAETDATGWEEGEDTPPPPMKWSAGWVAHRPTRAEPWWTLYADSDKDSERATRLTIPGGMVRQVFALGRLDKRGTFWQDGLDITPEPGSV